MGLRLRLSRSPGWLPAAILVLATVVALAAYGTPIVQIAVFGLYVVVGIALPGMLWVRLLRGPALHLSEDVALGLAVGYCVEIAAYLSRRARPESRSSFSCGRPSHWRPSSPSPACDNTGGEAASGRPPGGPGRSR